MPTMNEYEYLEAAPEWALPIADLINWSTNYPWPHTPYAVFLDLIGYGLDTYGHNLISGNISDNMGCIELHQIADALKVYVTRPVDTEDFILEFERLAMENA